ncbi:thermonuclease family protein [Salinithrix halophila]|uniref:Thermonuclease family protein n=1 Tax=Salinithrix halophila TaxID=1485204 RepID=A0ABV8JCI0_9BACL
MSYAMWKRTVVMLILLMGVTGIFAPVAGAEKGNTAITVAEATESGAVSIKEARSLIGKNVTTEGVVNVDNGLLQPGKLSVYIQDEEAGIQLFSHQAERYPSLREGDRVRVTGKVGEYRKVTQIMVEDVEVLNRGGSVEAEPVNLSDYTEPSTAEALEGKLVTLEGYMLRVPEYINGGANLILIDENLRVVTVRVWESTGIDLGNIQSNRWIHVTGISSQYGNTYQILPRSERDIRLSKVQKEKPIGEGKEVAAVVERVVDGDTIHLANPVLGTSTVRFLNMDTPETYHKVKDERDQNQLDHGLRAKEHLGQLLSSGDKVKLRIGEEALDGYGRILAEVIRDKDELNTNMEMVRKGAASTYFIWPFQGNTVKAYSQALKEAKEKGLGIWNREKPLLELPFVFRARERGSELYRPVGDFRTRYVVPAREWASVPDENRVFFNDEEEAERAGYRPLPFSRLERAKDFQSLLTRLYGEGEMSKWTYRRLTWRLSTIECHLRKLEKAIKDQNPRAILFHQKKVERAVDKMKWDILRETCYHRLSESAKEQIEAFPDLLRPEVVKEQLGANAG